MEHLKCLPWDYKTSTDKSNRIQLKMYVEMAKTLGIIYNTKRKPLTIKRIIKK